MILTSSFNKVKIAVRITFILIFAMKMNSSAQNVKALALGSIKLGSHISLYDDFRMVDKLPEKTIPESYLPKRSDRSYYVSSIAYSYLDQEVKHLILTADSLGKIVSIDIVLEFKDNTLEKMIGKYGSWIVASSMGHGANEQMDDITKQGVYVWKHSDDSLINLIISRHENSFLEDTVVITYSRKRSNAIYLVACAIL